MVNKFPLVLFFAFFLLISCSKKKQQTVQSESNQEHILKEQKRALDKAKGVEQMLKTAAQKQHQSIAEETK